MKTIKLECGCTVESWHVKLDTEAKLAHESVCEAYRAIRAPRHEKAKRDAQMTPRSNHARSESRQFMAMKDRIRDNSQE